MTAITISKIWSDGNIRFDENDVEELATSINRQGLIQPISVQKREDGNGGEFLLIAGHRRLAAVKTLGMNTIEAVFNDTVQTQADRISTQYAENVQRKDLSAYEQMQVALDLKTEGMNQGEVAKELGLSKGQVSKYQKTAKVIGELPNGDTAVVLTKEALFDLVDVEDEDGLVVENALRALVQGDASSVRQAIGGAEREARDVRLLERLEPIVKDLHDKGVTFVNEQPVRAEALARHHLDSNYRNNLGFDMSDVILHQSLDCHVAQMGKGYSGPVLTEYCLKPMSHRERGKSGLKEASADTKEQQRADDRTVRKAAKEEKQARKDRVAAVLSSSWTQKEAVSLIRGTVRLGSDANRVTSGALDLPKIRSKYGDYRDYGSEVDAWIDGLPANKQALAPIMVLAAYMYVEDMVGIGDSGVLALFEEA